MEISAAIALGSNVGDRRAHLDWAIAQLSSELAGFRASSIIETDPVDVPTSQPPYLNAVVTGATTKSPQELMALLLDLERQRGRIRTEPRAPRTLDLDLILYGNEIIRTADLEVPHPRFRSRQFVLTPLAEIAPDWRDPVTGKTIETLRLELDA